MLYWKNNHQPTNKSKDSDWGSGRVSPKIVQGHLFHNQFKTINHNYVQHDTVSQYLSIFTKPYGPLFK